ncbi:hypothetical protein H072_8850 [Dactylellina haptotyla CBS 200.50]|uniref:SWIRM domain-containing protein n=1 Tax=Dactylellina haptotyla (strain CBS 200.50) TaxID=1284197 RepID=S8A8L9_DACHA|nr:hypothetical protein H072_8850 [Dactylellina haptotyla CBS 200.50]
MEVETTTPILADPTSSSGQMPRTPEPSPFKRPSMSFTYSPRPDSSSGFTDARYSDKRAPSLSGILSPPPSPFIARQISEVPSDLGPSILNRDPVLYDTPLSDENQRPLFDLPEPYQEPSGTVSKPSFVASRESFKTGTWPQRRELPAPKFKSTAWQDCFRNPLEYYQRERAFLRQQLNSAKLLKSTKSAIPISSPKVATPAPKKLHQRARSTGSEMTASPKDKVRIHRSTDNKVTKPKFSRQSKPVTTTRKDVHYSTVEDVTPSADLLPDNPRCLHVDWSGAPLDISSDPDRHLLHKAEQHLASTLKLSCGQYLTQKRLIFLERVTRLRAGNTVFSRTHAQQVCHIDVNKASRLFAAFEKVGWLSPQALKHHL